MLLQLHISIVNRDIGLIEHILRINKGLRVRVRGVKGHPAVYFHNEEYLFVYVL